MKTALVLCVALGVLLLTLEAEAGRLTLEEGRKAKQLLSGTNLNTKASVGVNDVKTIAGEIDNKVASSEGEGEGSGDGESAGDTTGVDPTHRYFPDVVRPKGNP